MMTLPKNLSGQLIDFANEAAAALDSRIEAMSRMPNEVFPPFELPTLERFATQFGVSPDQVSAIDPRARCHFLAIQCSVIVRAGLLGVWHYAEAERIAVKHLGWHV